MNQLVKNKRRAKFELKGIHNQGVGGIRLTELNFRLFFSHYQKYDHTTGESILL